MTSPKQLHNNVIDFTRYKGNGHQDSNCHVIKQRMLYHQIGTNIDTSVRRHDVHVQKRDREILTNHPTRKIELQSHPTSGKDKETSVFVDGLYEEHTREHSMVPSKFSQLNNTSTISHAPSWNTNKELSPMGSSTSSLRNQIIQPSSQHFSHTTNKHVAYGQCPQHSVIREPLDMMRYGHTPNYHENHTLHDFVDNGHHSLSKANYLMQYSKALYCVQNHLLTREAERRSNIKVSNSLTQTSHTPRMQPEHYDTYGSDASFFMGSKGNRTPNLKPTTVMTDFDKRMNVKYIPQQMYCDKVPSRIMFSPENKTITGISPTEQFPFYQHKQFSIEKSDSRRSQNVKGDSAAVLMITGDKIQAPINSGIDSQNVESQIETRQSEKGKPKRTLQHPLPAAADNAMSHLEIKRVENVTSQQFHEHIQGNEKQSEYKHFKTVTMLTDNCGSAIQNNGNKQFTGSVDEIRNIRITSCTNKEDNDEIDSCNTECVELVDRQMLLTTDTSEIRRPDTVVPGGNSRNIRVMSEESTPDTVVLGGNSINNRAMSEEVCEKQLFPKQRILNKFRCETKSSEDRRERIDDRIEVPKAMDAEESYRSTSTETESFARYISTDYLSESQFESSYESAIDISYVISESDLSSNSENIDEGEVVENVTQANNGQEVNCQSNDSVENNIKTRDKTDIQCSDNIKFTIHKSLDGEWGEQATETNSTSTEEQMAEAKSTSTEEQKTKTNSTSTEEQTIEANSTSTYGIGNKEFDAHDTDQSTALYQTCIDSSLSEMEEENNTDMKRTIKSVTQEFVYEENGCAKLKECTPSKPIITEIVSPKQRDTPFKIIVNESLSESGELYQSVTESESDISLTITQSVSDILKDSTKDSDSEYNVSQSSLCDTDDDNFTNVSELTSPGPIDSTEISNLSEEHNNLKNHYVLVEGDTNVRPCKNGESNSIPCELEATTSAAVVSNTFTFSETLVENDDEEPSDGALNFGNTSESFQSALDTTDTEYLNHNNNCIDSKTMTTDNSVTGDVTEGIVNIQIEPMTSSLKSDYDVDDDRLETEFVNVSNEIEISEDSFYDVIETDESSLYRTCLVHEQSCQVEESICDNQSGYMEDPLDSVQIVDITSSRIDTSSTTRSGTLEDNILQHLNKTIDIVSRTPPQTVDAIDITQIKKTLECLSHRIESAPLDERPLSYARNVIWDVLQLCGSCMILSQVALDRLRSCIGQIVKHQLGFYPDMFIDTLTILFKQASIASSMASNISDDLFFDSPITDQQSQQSTKIDSTADDNNSCSSKQEDDNLNSKIHDDKILSGKNSIPHTEQEVPSSVDNSGGIKGADKINIMKESDENAINNFLERNVTPNTNRDGHLVLREGFTEAPILVKVNDSDMSEALTTNGSKPQLASSNNNVSNSTMATELDKQEGRMLLDCLPNNDGKLEDNLPMNSEKENTKTEGYSFTKSKDNWEATMSSHIGTKITFSNKSNTKQLKYRNEYLRYKRKHKIKRLKERQLCTGKMNNRDFLRNRGFNTTNMVNSRSNHAMSRSNIANLRSCHKLKQDLYDLGTKESLHGLKVPSSIVLNYNEASRFCCHVVLTRTPLMHPRQISRSTKQLSSNQRKSKSNNNIICENKTISKIHSNKNNFLNRSASDNNLSASLMNSITSENAKLNWKNTTEDVKPIDQTRSIIKRISNNNQTENASCMDNPTIHVGAHDIRTSPVIKMATLDENTSFDGPCDGPLLNHQIREETDTTCDTERDKCTTHRDKYGDAACDEFKKDPKAKKCEITRPHQLRLSADIKSSHPIAKTISFDTTSTKPDDITKLVTKETTSGVNLDNSRSKFKQHIDSTKALPQNAVCTTQHEKENIPKKKKHVHSMEKDVNIPHSVHVKRNVKTSHRCYRQTSFEDEISKLDFSDVKRKISKRDKNSKSDENAAFPNTSKKSSKDSSDISGSKYDRIEKNSISKSKQHQKLQSLKEKNKHNVDETKAQKVCNDRLAMTEASPCKRKRFTNDQTDLSGPNEHHTFRKDDKRPINTIETAGKNVFYDTLKKDTNLNDSKVGEIHHKGTGNVMIKKTTERRNSTESKMNHGEKHSLTNKSPVFIKELVTSLREKFSGQPMKGKQEGKDQNRKELANTSNLPHNNNKNYTREKDNQSVTENINKRKQQSSNENGNKTIKRMLSYPEHKINVDASPVKKQKSTDQKIEEVAQNQTNQGKASPKIGRYSENRHNEITGKCKNNGHSSANERNAVEKERKHCNTKKSLEYVTDANLSVKNCNKHTQYSTKHGHCVVKDRKHNLTNNRLSNEVIMCTQYSNKYGNATKTDKSNITKRSPSSEKIASNMVVTENIKCKDVIHFLRKDNISPVKRKDSAIINTPCNNVAIHHAITDDTKMQKSTERDFNWTKSHKIDHNKAKQKANCNGSMRQSFECKRNNNDSIKYSGKDGKAVTKDHMNDNNRPQHSAKINKTFTKDHINENKRTQSSAENGKTVTKDGVNLFNSKQCSSKTVKDEVNVKGTNEKTGVEGINRTEVFEKDVQTTPKTGDNNTAVIAEKKKKIESLHKVDENTNVDNENLVSDKNTRKISGVGKVKDLNETSRYNFMSDGGSRILKPHMEELQPILDSRDQKECIEKLNQEIVTGYCLQNEEHVAIKDDNSAYSKWLRLSDIYNMAPIESSDDEDDSRDDVKGMSIILFIYMV